MTTYRAGQRVRVEWPTGTTVEGIVSHVGGTRPEVYCVLNIGGAVSVDVPGRDDRTVTVLSEPRPDEPTGLGAVVEADYRPDDFERRTYIRRACGSPWGWVSADMAFAVKWSDLIDPVVLSEGWTP